MNKYQENSIHLARDFQPSVFYIYELMKRKGGKMTTLDVVIETGMCVETIRGIIRILLKTELIEPTKLTYGDNRQKSYTVKQ